MPVIKYSGAGIKDENQFYFHLYKIGNKIKGRPKISIMKSSNFVFQIFTATTMKSSISSACWLFHTGLLSGLLLETGNGGDMFLSIFGRLPPDYEYTVLYTRRQNSSVVILFEKLVENPSLNSPRHIDSHNLHFIRYDAKV
jgi:hypothetical protein